MNIEQINAMNRFAQKHGRTWKGVLSESWLRAGYPSGTPSEDQALLQQLRNNGGPSILEHYRPRDTAYGKLGFLKKDQMERFNLKRGWHVNAWRIVDEQGSDLVQPWSPTKKDARDTAESLGIFLVEDAA